MIVTIASTKGGVGKSSVATNLAAALARRGARVLVVDGDAQGSSTLGLGARIVDDGGFDSLVLGTSAEAGRVQALASTVDGVDVLPACSANGLQLSERVAQGGVPTTRLGARLGKWLETSGVRYDLVLIDTPGVAGVVVDQAVCASDAVLGVYQPETWAAHGVAALKRRITELTDDGASRAVLLGLVENGRTRTAQAAAWHRVISSRDTILGSVRRSQKITDAQAPGRVVKPLVARSLRPEVSGELVALADAVHDAVQALPQSAHAGARSGR